MLRGVLLIRFNTKLGPVPEGMVPHDFIDKSKIPEISMQIWANYPKTNESGFTMVHLNKVNLFGCLLYDNEDRLGSYCLASFFDSNTVDEVWDKLEDVKKLMEITNKKIKESMLIQEALQELYENIMKITAKQMVGKVLSDNVYSTFKDVFENMSKLISTIKNIQNSDLKEKLLQEVEKLSESLLTLSILWGGREIATLLIHRLLSILTVKENNFSKFS